MERKECEVLCVQRGLRQESVKSSLKNKELTRRVNKRGTALRVNGHGWLREVNQLIPNDTAILVTVQLWEGGQEEKMKDTSIGTE